VTVFKSDSWLIHLNNLLSSQGMVSVEILSGIQRRYYHQLEVRCTASFFAGLLIMLCPAFELSLQKHILF